MNQQLLDNTNFEKSTVSIARLTALWAFVEAGLGGVLHAFKIPFTGLLVGGMAVMLITLITHFSSGNPRKLFKCLIIVLMVKAMVSPHSPLAAYFAVSFQAVLGYLIYGVFKVNPISIFLFTVLAMLESAVQKLIILTLFFGSSFWEALDGLIGSVFKQFGMKVDDAAIWVVYLYVSIYFVGGIIIAVLISAISKELSSQTERPVFVRSTDTIALHVAKKSKSKKLLIVGLVLISISMVIFVFSEDTKSGLLAVGKSIFYTATVLFIWYAFLNPYLTKALKKFLKAKSISYESEVLDILSMIPEFKQMAASAWMLSMDKSGLARVKRFISILVYWTLTLTVKEKNQISEK
jgi:hypothetical protein